jgi:predicted DNA-binding transcriptional regulator AlpA
MPRRLLKNVRNPAALPDDDNAYVRLPTVLSVFPVGESTWHRGVAEGRFPRPVKLSARVSAYRVGKIRELLAAADPDGDRH